MSFPGLKPAPLIPEKAPALHLPQLAKPQIDLIQVNRTP
jgi:hypothetical protein